MGYNGGMMRGFGAAGQRTYGQQNPKGERRDVLGWHLLRFGLWVSVIVSVCIVLLVAGPLISGLAILLVLALALLNWYASFEPGGRPAQAFVTAGIFIFGLGIFWIFAGAPAAQAGGWPTLFGWRIHTMHNWLRVIVLAIAALWIALARDLAFRARNETTDPSYPGTINPRDPAGGPLGPGNPYGLPYEEYDEPAQVPPPTRSYPRPVRIGGANGNGHSGAARPLPPSDRAATLPAQAAPILSKRDERKAAVPSSAPKNQRFVLASDLIAFSRRRDTGTDSRTWKDRGWTEQYWTDTIEILEVLGAFKPRKPKTAVEFAFPHDEVMAAIFRLFDDCPALPQGAPASYLAAVDGESDRQDSDRQTGQTAPPPESGETGDLG